MSPWSTRLLSTGTSASTTAPPASHVPLVNLNTPSYNGSRVTAQQDSLGPEDPTSADLPRRFPAHGRSVSHPFPSLFGSGRRAGKRNDAPLTDVASDYRGEDALKDFSMNTQSSTAHKGQSQREDDDFMTGNCGTCDSTVRWPRQLAVYRCTVCLMVNDLKPAGGKEASATVAQPGPNANKPQMAPEPYPVPRIQKKGELPSGHCSQFP